ncbi:MAG: PHP domain-containing protein, partial [Streptosporangiaceae bacterium]
MVRIDLHTHSSASDGTDPPADVMRQAKAAGLDVVALTDHDTVGGHGEALGYAPEGLTFVPGMELSCRLDGHSVHMLAYLFDPGDPTLATECGRIRGDRVRRAEAMVARLAELGTGVTWEQVTALADGGVVGRPHIARALADDGAVDEPANAFS